MDLSGEPTQKLIGEVVYRIANNFTMSEAELERIAMIFHQAAEDARIRRETAASYTWEDRQTSNGSIAG